MGLFSPESGTELVRTNRLRTVLWAALISAFAIGCEKERPATPVKLPSYYVSNELAGGAIRQVLHVTNGLSFYFTETNLCVWFTDDSSLVVEFDPLTAGSRF